MYGEVASGARGAPFRSRGQSTAAVSDNAAWFVKKGMRRGDASETQNANVRQADVGVLESSATEATGAGASGSNQAGLVQNPSMGLGAEAKLRPFKDAAGSVVRK